MAVDDLLSRLQLLADARIDDRSDGLRVGIPPIRLRGFRVGSIRFVDPTQAVNGWQVFAVELLSSHGAGL